MPTQTQIQGEVSLKTPETPKHAWQSQAKLKGKTKNPMGRHGMQPAKSAPPQKVLSK